MRSALTKDRLDLCLGNSIEYTENCGAPRYQEASLRRICMKTRLGFELLCGLLIAIVAASEAQAQTAASAQVHVDAAKAAVNPKNPNPQKWQVFDYLFNMHCTEPKAGAGPGEGGNNES